MRIGSMLAAIDFSDTALAALQWATEYVAPEAALTLAHVVDPPDLPAFARFLVPSAEEIIAVAREDAERRMRNVAAQLPHRARRCEVRVGKPHEEIRALVRVVDADLVVIGPHGNRPRPPNLLGTTAERVVRTSPVPVLVAAAPPSRCPRNILVPVDDSSITPIVLEWARDLATAFDAEVTLLHVWSNAAYSHLASMSYAKAPSDEDAGAEINRELRDAAFHWIDELTRSGFARDRVAAAVTHGKAGDAVLEQAHAIDADLIVLGRHGSGLVAPALLGSTIGSVLRGARCPVLAVTARPEDGPQRGERSLR